MSVRSPSETLMSALEDVEKSEHVLIIIDHGDEGISWHCDTNRMSVKLALSEFVSECIRDSIRRARDED